MGINKKQFEFTKMLALLILFAYEKGYTIQMGDVFAKSGHIDGSFHYKHLAVDVNLFKDAVYLSKTSDHLLLGEFWESIRGTWGGRWGDGNHYSHGEGAHA